MKAYRVNLTEYELGWGSKVFDVLYFKKEENVLSYIKEYNSKNNLSNTPDYYTQASLSDNQVEVAVKLEDYSPDFTQIEFECTGSNYGAQVLAFNNEEIDVILRNQNKNIRNHNSQEKETIKYRITIERL
jgi:hypothetical protein